MMNAVPDMLDAQILIVDDQQSNVTLLEETLQPPRPPPRCRVSSRP